MSAAGAPQRLPHPATPAVADVGEAGFAAALLDAAGPTPPGLRTFNGSDPAVRFAVYRNNVVSSLVAALAETFPVVRELVGADFFAAMARLFVAAHPPSSPRLAEYGAALADFIAGFAPAAQVPYLADVARLEFARVCAFHAADAPALAAPQLAARLARPESLPGARVVMHPALQVIVSPHAVASIWAAHQGLVDLSTVDTTRAEAALVLREDDDAAVIPVPHAAAEFVRAWQLGRTLAEAMEAAAAPSADGQIFDLPSTLALLISHGVLSDWISPEVTP